MPSGYTAALYDGPQEFEDFVLRCARAMGALVSMREAPLEALIPDRFEVEPHHEERFALAEARLAELEAMTEQEKEEAVRKFNVRQRLAAREAAVVVGERRARFEATLDRVRAWEPPTADHEGLKELMVQQLEEGLAHECREAPAPAFVDAASHWETRVEMARADVARSRQAFEDAVKMAAQRSAWVAELRASLGGE